MMTSICRIGFGSLLGCIAAGAAFGQSAPNQTTFRLSPNPAFLSCIAASPKVTPVAVVNVKRGPQRDSLTIDVKGLKPNLKFDLFTVQRSNLDAEGRPVANFPGFGMAWYQSDLNANSGGEAKVTVNTILLDQIFGFDPDASIGLAPTNTFHVGFWFNRPQDAQDCGFDVTKPTPFNGEHTAGPLAMISVPKPNTGLGPLCVNPNTSTHPATCNP